jgi:hypothetical protein
VLVVHGAYDFRVPEGQAFELFTSLQRLGVESKFLYFPDETHFVSKPQNSRLWWKTVFDWLGVHYKNYLSIKPEENMSNDELKWREIDFRVLMITSGSTRLNRILKNRKNMLMLTSGKRLKALARKFLSLRILKPFTGI